MGENDNVEIDGETTDELERRVTLRARVERKGLRFVDGKAVGGGSRRVVVQTDRLESSEFVHL